MTTNNFSPDDLDWLAFQYVAGELQGADLEAFEDLLASDDRACSAVAQAVQITEAVVCCEHDCGQSVNRELRSARVASPVRQLGLQPAKRQLWRGLLAVACSAASVAVMISWLNLQAPPEQLLTGSETAVAALWVHNADDEATHDLVTATNTELHDSEEEDAVPAWLLAAVTEEQQTETDDEEVMQE